MDDREKQQGTCFYNTLSFLHHFVAIGAFKLFKIIVQKRLIWVKIDDFF